MMLTGWKEWSVAGVAAIGVYSVYWLGGAWNHSVIQTLPETGSYEMQRVKKEFVGEFDLSNREIIYTRTGQLSSSTSKVNSTQMNKPTELKALGAKAPVKAAAKVDPKKAAEAKQRAALVAKQAAKQKEIEKRRLSVRVVDTSRSAGLSQGGNSATGPTNVSAMVYMADRSNAPKVNTLDKTKDQEEDTRMSPGQWFSLLQAQPTSTNAKKFRDAKAQLGEKYYYEIIAKLLRDSQADRQKMAVAILANDISVGTFQFLVKPPEDVQKNETIMKGLNPVLQAYGGDKNRFSILASALASKDSQVVLGAMILIEQAAKNIAIQGSESEVRPPTLTPTPAPTARVAAPSVRTLKKDDFKIFKQSLGRLSQNSNSQISQIARSLVATLWDASPPSAQVAQQI